MNNKLQQTQMERQYQEEITGVKAANVIPIKVGTGKNTSRGGVANVGSTEAKSRGSVGVTGGNNGHPV